MFIISARYFYIVPNAFILSHDQFPSSIFSFTLTSLAVTGRLRTPDLKKTLSPSTSWINVPKFVLFLTVIFPLLTTAERQMVRRYARLLTGSSNAHSTLPPTSYVSSPNSSQSSFNTAPWDHLLAILQSPRTLFNAEHSETSQQCHSWTMLLPLLIHSVQLPLSSADEMLPLLTYDHADRGACVCNEPNPTSTLLLSSVRAEHMSLGWA